MKNKKSVIALIISAALIITIIFSAGYIVKEAEHDCTGHDCPICANIWTFVHRMQALGFFCAILLLALIGVYKHKFISLLRTEFEHGSTLVNLKIKLSC